MGFSSANEIACNIDEGVHSKRVSIERDSTVYISINLQVARMLYEGNFESTIARLRVVCEVYVIETKNVL